MNTKSSHPCPYCATRFEDHEALKAHVVAEHGTEPLPKPYGLISLIVNHQNYEFKVEANTTLYELIHDQMGLTGSKMFCDRGACGSCTVIMDGRPILSCMTLAIECDGKKIETIEGVAQAEHPLVETYVKHHAMQCGYCTPGMILTAVALLNKHPHPSDAQILDWMNDNLCRCGGYLRILRAIHRAAGQTAGVGAG